MKTHTEPQWKAILAYLESGGSLTRMQALEKFDCINLPGRIHDIRKYRPDVNLPDPEDVQMIKTPSGKWVARYSLEKEPELQL